MSDFSPTLKEIIQEQSEISQRISQSKNTLRDLSFKDVIDKLLKNKKLSSLGKSDIRCRRNFRGHLSKIYALQWSRSSDTFVSAAQDGKLLVWDAYTGNKLYMVMLRNIWVVSCGYSPNGRMVCAGGLQNDCTVYRLNEVFAVDQNPSSVINKENNTTCTVSEFKLYRELIGHTGFISGCKFLNENQLITTSSDKTSKLWDIECQKIINSFDEHEKDISSLALSPERNSFLTGSFDSTCRLYDIRTKRNVQVFERPNRDFNCVSFLENGQQFVTGSSDSACTLWDIRADAELHSFIDENYRRNEEEVGCVCASISGRYLFSTYESPGIHVWDMLSGEKISFLSGHTNRISCMELSPNGYALLSGGWDLQLKLWFK